MATPLSNAEKSAPRQIIRDPVLSCALAHGSWIFRSRIVWLAPQGSTLPMPSRQATSGSAQQAFRPSAPVILPWIGEDGWRSTPSGLELLAKSTLMFAVRLSPYPAIIFQSAKVAIAESDSNSVAYENHTNSAKSEGLEKIGWRERSSASDRVGAVRRFAREALGYWRFQRAKIQRRIWSRKGWRRERNWKRTFSTCFSAMCRTGAY